MRFTWPPSEANGWDIQTHKQKEKKPFYLPLQNQDFLLLAVRIVTDTSANVLEIPMESNKSFLLEIKTNEWTMLPLPIEQHAIGPVWETIEVPLEYCQIQLGYYPWTTRHFRMRALLDSEGKMLFAYRINKKGQTVSYLPPKDHTMTLPEDTYIIPPTHLINEKSILLVSAQSKIEVKKLPESRYFTL
jgi:hypothetical protein